MYFRQFFDSANAAMSYLLADLPSKQAVVIDPSSDTCQSLLLMSLLAERELTLAHILLTHTHRQAANDLADHYRGTPIVVGKHTRSSIGDRLVEQSWFPWPHNGGFTISTFLFLLFSLPLLGRRNPVEIMGVAALTTGALLYAFGYFFQIMLP